MKNTLNPVYNESITFDVTQDQVENMDMIVKVIDYDRYGLLINFSWFCIGISKKYPNTIAASVFFTSFKVQYDLAICLFGAHLTSSWK
jgi:hypothetical protein